MYLCIFMTEDSIIGKQEDYDLPPPYIVDNYVHRHVLRCSLNGEYGTLLKKGIIEKNRVFRKCYTVTLTSTWNAPHCSAVAFVYADHGTESGKIHKEIQQVTEAKIIE
jgi:hypothetical protein